MGSNLLPMAEKSSMPVQGCNVFVQLNFSKQALLVNDFVVPVSQSVKIFFLQIYV